MPLSYVSASTGTRADSVGNGTWSLTTTANLTGYFLVLKTGSGSSNVTATAVSGGGLTWTRRVLVPNTASNAHASIWTADATNLSPGAVTVTVTFSNAAAGTSIPSGICLERYTGAGLASTPATNTAVNDTDGSGAFTTNVPGAAITFVAADWNGVAGTPAYATGFTQSGAPYQVSGAVGIYYGKSGSIANTGTYAYGMSAPSSGVKYVLAGLELIVVNRPPTANAGPDQTVPSGSTVSLNGSGSMDPDGTITYAWSVASAGGTGLTTASITNRFTATPTFTAPSVSTTTTVTLRLTVTDDDGATDFDDVAITVSAVRSGTGWASGVGLSAAASGAATRRASGTARVGLAAAGTGSKAAQGAGQARSGVSARGAGVKRGTGTGWSPSITVRTDGRGLKRANGVGLAPPLGLSAFAVTPPPVPLFNGRSLSEDPLPLATSRYLVQNILTGEWLHTDLPLTEDQVTLTLSGPCEIAGKVTPETADLKAPDGSALLRSWGHVVYLEMDGEIRAAGMVTEDSYDDQTMTLACQGVSAYPSVIAYQGAYRRYFADPVQVVADMWAYVQSFSNGNLGVATPRMGGQAPVLFGGKVNPVPGDKVCGVPYGSKAESDTQDDPPTLPVQPQYTVPGVYAKLVAMGYNARTQPDLTKPIGPDNTAPPGTLFVRKADLERAYNDYFLTPGQPYGTTLYGPPDALSAVTIDPYKVDWWDVKACGEIIDEAIKALPGDYVEQYAWNYPRTFVDQAVLTAYPRIGRRRDDLRFVQGENITSPAKLDADPDGFATCVVGIGAGEGSKALRETAEVILPGRTRKVYVYRNGKITDRTVLARIVGEELRERSLGGHKVQSVVVLSDHVNAPFGAYNVGDDIFVQVTVPHIGLVQQWSRITSMTLARGAGLVQLNLKRSDAFRYGREVES